MRKVVVAVALVLAACSSAPRRTTETRSYRCEKDGGCTVTVQGRPTRYGPGAVVPVACAPGIVIVAGCGCGYLPPGVIVSCGCGPVAASSCGCGAVASCGAGCGASCGGGCGGCGCG
ncbi:MAG TPA: hypothetical protein VMB50_22355 [Myxococcales bacterium]|nr:hypothetical protein [Myxococcales bacterium]